MLYLGKMRPIFLWVTLATSALLSVGCSSDAAFQAAAPSNVAGSYTLTLTNGDNGCMLEKWTTGASNSGIPFLATQSGSDLNGELQGVAALSLALFIGTNKFTGSVSADHFDMTAYGTIARQQGTCTFNMNARVVGTIAGDAISGTISYSPATTTNPGCASVQCTSTQSFNGTRPPPP